MIVAAAIRIREVVYALPAPARHHDIIHMLAARGIKARDPDEQGFVDSNRGFVGRIEAADIARTEGQLTKPLDAPPRLFSEDLW